MENKPAVSAALTRYRVIAWVVGTLLIGLMFVAMPLKYLGGEDVLVAVISPVHGFAYMVYLVLAFDLARRLSWPLWPRTVLLLLAGTIPVLSFVVEHRTHVQVRARLAEQDTSEPTPVS